MKAIKFMKKWVLFVSALLFLFGLGFFGIIGQQDASGKIIAASFGLLFIGGALVLFIFAYNRANAALSEQDSAEAALLRQEAIKKEQNKQQAASRLAEWDEYQYTFEGAQTVANHTVVDYAPTGYDAQVMLYGLKIGDEIHVFRNYEGKYAYTMDNDVPLPPRIVNIYERKRICRLYVYKINDDNPERRSIQILVVYNPE